MKTVKLAITVCAALGALAVTAPASHASCSESTLIGQPYLLWVYSDGAIYADVDGTGNFHRDDPSCDAGGDGKYNPNWVA